MSKQSELNSYVAALRQRLRLGASARGAVVFAATALVATIALVLVLNHFAFPAHGLTGARLALAVALAAAGAWGIALPLMRLSSAQAVRQAEAENLELEQRLTTFQENASNKADGRQGDPFIELLAADTLARTQYAEPASFVPDSRLFALGGVAAACLGALAWMIAAGPGYLGYGASLLWTGTASNAAPLYALTVAPGSVAVRRNSDELIAARVTGMRPDKVQLFAHFEGAAGWEPVTMQALADSAGAGAYQFTFAGLPENVEYYVTAGPLVSPHYHVRVVDLPTLKDIRVTYHYPKWTGMPSVSEEHSGDLRAIEGTEAQIELQMDHPLKNGQLVLEGGQAIHLEGGQGNVYRGSISMQKDGAYHLAATDQDQQDQQVRLSEDYFIATDKAQPPQVSIARPVGDYRASPIEEVAVGVRAADQFGLKDVHLHYSVNGGADHDVSLLKTPGLEDADGSYTLPLEDFKLVPGDLISLYATARDGHLESRTDIGFIQVDPFEREFSQSQQSGGGGGGSGGGKNDQTEISKREKELISATWKQQNNKDASAKDAAVAGQFLADAQQKLRDQVMALSARMQSRDLSEANEEFTGFDKDMQMAAAAMAPSTGKLKDMQWQDAIPLEQKALQALLRAEATFRQIQVAFGQRGGGGGGGANSAGRDLASLFDLELDTEKNQYETAQSASPAEQHEKDVEDALEKLDALAKRQGELANQQHNPQQTFQEHWQQEMLRREAEQLQQQMEQMAKNEQTGQQGREGRPSRDGSQNQQQGSSRTESNQSGVQPEFSSSGSQSQPPSRSSNPASDDQWQNPASRQISNSDERIEQALSRLREADDAMKRTSNPQQSSEEARRAADRLQQAGNLLSGTQQQLASDKVGTLAQEAARLAEQERAQSGRINKLVNAGHQADPNQPDLSGMLVRRQELNRLTQERQQLSNDLSALQKNMRDTARATAANRPDVAKKLRDALTEMDDFDLDNHLQRTADWLHSGINPNSNGTESEIAQGLQKLTQQLQSAQQAMVKSKPGDPSSTQGDNTAILNQVERLRSQIEALANSRRGADQDGHPQAAQGPNAQNGKLRKDGKAGEQPGSGGQHSGESGQGIPQQSGLRGGQGATGQGQGGVQGTTRWGDLATRSADARTGGGHGADGTAWNNINTGNNRYGQAEKSMSASGDNQDAIDPRRTYEQGIQALNELRHATQADLQAAKSVADLTRQMQQLDPSRFPGNPAMVEQMNREVLSAVDRLERQLQHDRAGTDARTDKPYIVPAGYQDAVADYYRRLSANPQAANR